MIILFDEKIKRQENYGWTKERFDKYNENIISIRSYEVFDDPNAISNYLVNGNVILFHESFLNEVDADRAENAKSFKDSLSSQAEKGEIKVAFFGGSKASRKIEGNVAFLPVHDLYEHLQAYIEQSINGKDCFEYLLWGSNPLIEEELLDKISAANADMICDESYKIESNYNILIFTTLERSNRLLVRSLNAKYIPISYDLTSDEPLSNYFMHSFVKNNLDNQPYDCIYLPLCFGPVLSDYNGLRLALHIRCTNTINQYKPIFIYSVANMSSLIGNEYFDILKTKGVELISYDEKSILAPLKENLTFIDQEILKNEIKKVRLNIPENYLDSHSVANEWAIYRWAEAIGASDKDISKLNDNVKTNLYFKYLNTISPVSSLGKLTKNDLKIKSAVPPKVLLVDDEAEKGWYEVFCEIIEDVNGFSFCHLDDEFNNKSSEEIAGITLEKIKNEDIDIVLLDFRLHKSDFVTKNTEEITGYKILERVKKYNAGVQVVVVSATNKIWNWEKLREAGADGFILKESPSVYQSSNTVEIIKGFVDSVQKCCDRLFLKKFYADLESLKSNYLPRENKKHAKPLDKNFVKETMTWFELSCDAFKHDNSRASITSAYLFLFSVLENMSNRIIRVDSPETDYDTDGNEIDKYKFQNGDYLKSFVNYKKTTFELTCLHGKAIVWTQKILNTLDYISVGHNNAEISLLVSKRNDFIHKNSTSGCNSEIELVDVEKLHKIVYDGLINMK